jgi:hypothetical protein
MKICLALLLGVLPLAGAVAAESSTPADWSIRATFPGPTKVESSEEEAAGGTVKQVSVSADDGDESFGIFQMTFPGAVAENQLELFYQSAKQSGLREGKGVLLKEEKTAIADHEGRRYVVDFPAEERRRDFRVTVISQTLYMAGYEAPTASYSPDRAKAFFRSIRPKAPGPESPVETVSSVATPATSRPAATPRPATPRKRAAPDHWALEATFPQPPKTITAEEQTPFGPVMNTTLAFAQGQVIYALSRVIYPVATADTQLDEIFESSKKSLLLKGKGSLQREEKVTVADLPGRRYVVDYAHEFVLDDYRADYRFVMIDHALYIVMYRSPLNTYSAENGRAFFKSVRKKPR